MYQAEHVCVVRCRFTATIKIQTDRPPAGGLELSGLMHWLLLEAAQQRRRMAPGTHGDVTRVAHTTNTKNGPTKSSF